ncbi:retrovirus-related Pol polyprotein from transposon 17.6 [Nephila pilipes]|uniref:Retrovirus-related Pol polyprotein from transposon 17.6 n=1 Tax=Nephila pilipes TaxID=299642 RepID=A0A8X6UGC0_NEPPI|nr:retrovirus-related Pol polyprotein from transposon 17.6 [Nephila pilipes]
MAEEQQNDSQLQDILAGSCSSSLLLHPLPMGQAPVTLYCDVSTGRIRPFAPEFFRREIFNSFHALSQPGIRASLKLSFRYFLTCVDRFSKCPEAFPLVEILAGAMAKTFYTSWITRFGPPLRLTADQ